MPAVENAVPVSPVANVTDDREAHPKQWHIALVQMNCEKRISRKLDTLRIENFVPTQTEIHMWSDRRKKVDRIVLPMSVFVHVNDEQLRTVRELSSVFRMMSYPGDKRPAEIPSAEVERFRQMLQCTESQVSIEEAPLQAGEKVVISRGSLRGLYGELTSVTDDKSHVIIRIGCLGCASIDIPSTYVERISETKTNTKTTK